MIFLVIIWYFVLLQLFLTLKISKYVQKVNDYYENINPSLKKIVQHYTYLHIGLSIFIFLCICMWTWVWWQTSGNLKNHCFSILIAVIIIYSGVLYANLGILIRPKKLYYQYLFFLLGIIVLPFFAFHGNKIQWSTRKRLLWAIPIFILLHFIPTRFLRYILGMFAFFLIFTIPSSSFVKNQKKWIWIWIPLSLFASFIQIAFFRRMNQQISSEILKKGWKKRDWVEPINVLNSLEEYFVIYQKGIIPLLPVRPIVNPYFLHEFSKPKRKQANPKTLFLAIAQIYKKWKKKVIHVYLIPDTSGCCILWEKDHTLHLDIVFRGTKKTEEWVGNILGGINVFSPTDDMRKHAEINAKAHIYAPLIQKFINKYQIKSPVRVFGHSRGTVIAFMTTLQLLRLCPTFKFELFLVAPPGMFDPQSFQILLHYKDRLEVNSISHTEDSLHKMALMAPFGLNLFGNAVLIDKIHQENNKAIFHYLEPTLKKSLWKIVKRPFWDIDKNTELSNTQKTFYKNLKGHKEPHKILYYYLLVN